MENNSSTSERRVVIELDNVKRDFIVGSETVHALRGISFKIYEGEFVTIMGTSGSGKSTLLNQLGCLDTPTSGEYYLDGVLQPDPAVAMTDGIVLSGISVPANGNTTLIYSATVNAFAPLETGAAITNTVTVESRSVSAVTAEESVAVTNAAELSIVKSVTPIPVPENGELTYTFQLLNAGNTAVLDTENATVTDTFNPVLSDISVMLDGTALTEGVDYTYDEATGEFATANGVIAIPAATFTQDQTTGEWSASPGSVTLAVTGRISAA